MTNIFDLIAFLLFTLGDSVFTKYSGIEHQSIEISAESDERINHFIDDTISYYDKNNISYLTAIITKGIPTELVEKYIYNSSFLANKDAVFILTQTLAKRFFNTENILMASEAASARDYFIYKSSGFKQLNTDQSVKKTTFILLPDLGTIGDGDKYTETITTTTTTYEKVKLNKLIVLKTTDLTTRKGDHYEIVNVLPSKGTHSKKPSPDDELIIAVSPLTDKWLLIDKPETFSNEYGNKEYFFSCEGIKDENLITSRVEKALHEAYSHGAYILLFPEMYGTKSLSESADRIIKNDDDHVGPLVVMPSWWHDNKNEAAVLDDALVTIFSQKKHSPFLYVTHDLRYKHKSLEKLVNEDHIIYLYHFPSIGRICVCICKDFLMDSYRRMLTESLEASIILVPAFSPEVNQFTKCMGELGHAGTYGVFVNCCAASCNATGLHTPVTKKTIIGEVASLKPIRSNNDRSWELLNPICNGNCGGPETCCVFIIKIRKDGSVSSEHIYK